MHRRLPPRDGEWIDRSQPVEFRFEGRIYRGFFGDVLSSALWACDVRLLGRSFKYHRPRGIYSLAGHDANVIVEDSHRTNIRGDTLAIHAGLDVHSVNTIGGLEKDRLGITEKFSAFLPVGFYYKAFHTPRRLFAFCENQMRKVAGLGKINTRNDRPRSPKDYAFCDLLVVGAGPAGLSAAVAAGEQGLDVLVVDEQPRPGGSLTWQWARDARAGQHMSRLLDRIAALEKVQLRCGTLAAGCYADQWIALVDSERLTKLRAKSMVFATGTIEQPAIFQNNDLPGIMSGSAAQRLIHLFAVKPFDRAVVLVSNSDGYRVALDLNEAGVAVAAVVDLRAAGELTQLGQDVEQAGIAVYRGCCIYEAAPAQREKRVRGTDICPLDNAGHSRIEARTHIQCDGVAISVGWAPNSPLVSQSGGRFRYSDRTEQFVPYTLPDGVFVAGRANGVYDLDRQIDDGHRCGLAAAVHLGQFAGEIPKPHERSIAMSHPYPIIAHPGRKNFVDFDEDLHLTDIENSHQEGYDNIELLKRFSTFGMGPSQGKLSNVNSVRILANLNNASINETGTTTARPFYQPVSIGHLAGRRFHPQRHTPMDRWHRDSRAAMVHAGAWQRPDHYEVKGRSRGQCILDEAVNVRNNVGVIDVSTLGKLWVSGRDAVSFLERIYTGRFTKQPVGRLRYGIACDETGIIIEDGILGRIAEDRFYVTATSSGVAAFYREMQRFALIWGMDVVLTNATGHVAAMNIAGPASRETLQKLTDVDLSADAFPYLGLTNGTVADAPATLIRVGFVGELGYEIHVPVSFALHVWKSLFCAGETHSIRPFGVEAQRLLRLEKGHLIVSHDTDALTNPFEADVAWTIGRNKSFFVGSRSLDIQRKKPVARRLVGLTFARDTVDTMPEECNLIIADDEIVGRITSIAPRTTLGYPVAMAFVRPDLANVGTNLKIRLETGSLTTATVAKMPFYDPENTRQKAAE